MNKLILGLLTIAALGTIVLPAYADEANVQTSTQIVTQDGEGNTALQRNIQTIRTSTRNVGYKKESRSSQGNVQDSSQDTYQSGYDNYGQMTNRQRIQTHQNRVQKKPVNHRYDD
jgi:hypothetical protein